MNNDLISRSALRKNVNSFFDSHYKGIVSSDLIKYAEAVDDFIENAPTIESEPNDCVLKEFGKCSYKETGCSDCYLKERIRRALDEERIRRALDEKCYEIGHADGARLGYEKGLKEASNYSEGWMDGYNHALDQTFRELNNLVKNHVLAELRKQIKR